MCTNPRKFAFPRAFLPCGQCFECRMLKANDWATRLLAEAHTTPPVFFITLTYSEEHLPRMPSHRPTFNRQHLKTVLRELTRVKPLRYYAIGEHGTQFERPHYHVLTFGVDSYTIDNVLQKWWPFGHYTIGDHMNSRIMYVALFHALKSNKYSDEFCVMSRNPGIGCYFFCDVDKKGRKCDKHLRISNSLLNQMFRQTQPGFIMLGNEKRLLPRYFIDLIGDSELRERIKETRRIFAMSRLNTKFGTNISNFIDMDEFLQSLDKDILNDWCDELKEINRRKIETFKKRHRKSRHIDSLNIECHET